MYQYDYKKGFWDGFGFCFTTVAAFTLLLFLISSAWRK